MRSIYLSFLFLVSTPILASANNSYSIISLNTSTGLPLIGERINDSGDIAAIQFGDTTETAFIWSRGIATSLASDETPFTAARGINNAGVAIGSWAGIDDNEGGGAMWKRGSFTELGDVYTALAQDINDAGVVVGYSTADDGSRHIFRWTSKMGAEDLGLGQAAAVNNSGEIVGSRKTIQGLSQAFVMRGLNLTTLSIQGADQTTGMDINNSGDILLGLFGYQGSNRCAVYQHGALRVLPLPSGATGSSATAMNDRGDVVGAAADNDGNVEAVLWPAAGGVKVLGSLSQVPAGINLATPKSINNRGQIVVIGSDIDGNLTSYLLTPSH